MRRAAVRRKESAVPFVQPAADKQVTFSFCLFNMCTMSYSTHNIINENLRVSRLLKKYGALFRRTMRFRCSQAGVGHGNRSRKPVFFDHIDIDILIYQMYISHSETGVLIC